MSEAFIPVLAAFHASEATWEVWCEHCRAWHRHGAGEGHRAAHCSGHRIDRRTGGTIATERWEHGYFISDRHGDAGISEQRRRPKLEPIAWHAAAIEATQ